MIGQLSESLADSFNRRFCDLPLPAKVVLPFFLFHAQDTGLILTTINRVIDWTGESGRFCYLGVYTLREFGYLHFEGDIVSGKSIHFTLGDFGQ